MRVCIFVWRGRLAFREPAATGGALNLLRQKRLIPAVRTARIIASPRLVDVPGGRETSSWSGVGAECRCAPQGVMARAAR